MIRSFCSFTYDEAKGLSEANIPERKLLGAFPNDWRCPRFGTSKRLFKKKDTAAASPEGSL